MKKIKSNEIEIWQLLRTFFLFEYSRKNIDNKKSNSKMRIKKDKRKLLSKIIFSFISLKNLFKSGKIFLISSEINIKELDGTNSDRLFFKYKSIFGDNQLIYFHNKSSNKIKKYWREYCSLEILRLIAKIIAKGKKHRMMILNEHYLDEINKTYDLYVDYKQIICEFFLINNMLKIILKIKKPKLVFISQYYNIINQAIIYQCSKLKIPTYEVQHGVINKFHFAYNFYGDYKKDITPENILVYSNLEKELFENLNFAKFKAHEVGVPILEYYKFKYKKKDLRNNFDEGKFKNKKIISTVLQIENQSKLLELVERIVKIDNDLIFLISPRIYDQNLFDQFKNEQIIFLNENKVYENILEGDIHLTCFSTTALEAPYLGKPNILYDLNNLATKYYGNILEDNKITKFINDEYEFLDVIKKFDFYDNISIMENYKIISENFEKNMMDIFVDYI